MKNFAWMLCIIVVIWGGVTAYQGDARQMTEASARGEQASDWEQVLYSTQDWFAGDVQMILKKTVRIQRTLPIEQMIALVEEKLDWSVNTMQRQSDGSYQGQAEAQSGSLSVVVTDQSLDRYMLIRWEGEQESSPSFIYEVDEKLHGVVENGNWQVLLQGTAPDHTAINATDQVRELLQLSDVHQYADDAVTIQSFHSKILGYDEQVNLQKILHQSESGVSLITVAYPLLSSEF